MGKSFQFFLNLKKDFLNKAVPELVYDIATVHNGIETSMDMQHKFYNDLFKTTSATSIPESKYAHLLQILLRLSKHFKEKLDYGITIEELDFVTKSSKLYKAPSPFPMNCSKRLNQNYNGFSEPIRKLSRKIQYQPY